MWLNSLRERNKRMIRFSALLLLLLHPSWAEPPTVDTSTLTGKIVCGYQGWFRCEGDGSDNGWHHYGGRDGFSPGNAGIEMWPDVREIPAKDRIATSFKFADGTPAEVFSSVKASVVDLHFKWMQEYGIDGAMVQRFATSTRDARYREPMNQVLDNCRTAAKAHGRGWALMYDLSGMKAGQMETVIDDWKNLIRDGRVPHGKMDRSYFQHHGRPLVALWGLGFHDRDPMLDDWERLIEFLQHNPEFGGCSIMLGVPYHWRTGRQDAISDPKLQQIIATADIVSPWAVGRIGTPQDAAQRVESTLKPDLARCAEMKNDYLPVIFPGFSWQNLKQSRGESAKFNAIPRLGGKFLWNQALAARRAGATMLYVAMFDEMDEGTAIFKTNQQPPVGENSFLAEPDLPSDHYLWLTGRIGQMLRGELPAIEEMPVRQNPAGSARTR